MALVEQTIQADPARLTVTPVIAVVGDTLTLAAVNVILDGTAAGIPESSFVATSRPNKTDVMGYFVRRLSDSVILLFVDEVEYDGVDSNYEFNGSPYEPLYSLFQFQLPANVTNIAAQNVTVRVVVPTVVPAPPPEPTRRVNTRPPVEAPRTPAPEI